MNPKRQLRRARANAQRPARWIRALRSIITTLAGLVALCVARSTAAADLAAGYLVPLLVVCVLALIVVLFPSLIVKIGAAKGRLWTWILILLRRLL